MGSCGLSCDNKSVVQNKALCVSFGITSLFIFMLTSFRVLQYLPCSIFLKMKMLGELQVYMFETYDLSLSMIWPGEAVCDGESCELL
jgi:hypothetical protein